MNIKEDYVTLEVAKLLKEKGFNDNYPKGDCTQIACTQQMAMAWLRKRGIYIMIDKDFSTVDGWHYFITTKTMWESDRKDNGIFDTSNGWKYEDAVNRALEYSLKHLI